MIQVLRHSCSVAIALALVLVSPLAMAGGDSTATAIRELATNSDFRVRTQAALSLGSSDDNKAVEPLCRALDDSKSAVRAAAAAALGKLGRGGTDCLSAGGHGD
jgi:HEAT repeat protein